MSALLFGPLLALLWAAGEALAQGHADWLLLALPLGRRAALLLRSLGLAAGVALLDMTLGVLLVSASWRWRRPWLRWLSLALLALPPTIHALAWNAALSFLGVRLAGPWVSLWVSAMALLPVGVGLALVSLETVARPLVDSARTCQTDLSVLARVVLPLAAPLLAAGGGILFLLSLMDYSIPSLYGVNVYALEIFAEFSASYAPARALLLAAPLLVTAAVLLSGGQSWLRRAAQQPTWRLAPWGAPPRFPGAFALAQQLAVTLWGLQMALPLFVLVTLAFGGGEGLAMLADAVSGPVGREFGLSLGIAGAAALLSAPLSALALSWFNAPQRGVPRRGVPRRGAGWALFLPAALPAPLVGVGLIALWNRPEFGALYPSLALPVLAALARFTPFAALALLAQLRRVDPLLWDAAHVFQSSGARIPRGGALRTLLRVQLPLALPGLLTGMCLVFALTLGELGATLLVAPPGQSTLTLRIYNYLHYGASDSVAGLCLALAAATLAAGGLSVVFLNWGARKARRARWNHE
jgi:iron(III) transport system permease protein